LNSESKRGKQNPSQVPMSGKQFSFVLSDESCKKKKRKKKRKKKKINPKIKNVCALFAEVM